VRTPSASNDVPPQARSNTQRRWGTVSHEAYTTVMGFSVRESAMSALEVMNAVTLMNSVNLQVLIEQEFNVQFSTSPQVNHVVGTVGTGQRPLDGDSLCQMSQAHVTAGTVVLGTPVQRKRLSSQYERQHGGSFAQPPSASTQWNQGAGVSGPAHGPQAGSGLGSANPDSMRQDDGLSQRMTQMLAEMHTLVTQSAAAGAHATVSQVSQLLTKNSSSHTDSAEKTNERELLVISIAPVETLTLDDPRIENGNLPVFMASLNRLLACKPKYQSHSVTLSCVDRGSRQSRLGLTY